MDGAVAVTMLGRVRNNDSQRVVDYVVSVANQLDLAVAILVFLRIEIGNGVLYLSDYGIKQQR